MPDKFVEQTTGRLSAASLGTTWTTQLNRRTVKRKGASRYNFSSSALGRQVPKMTKEMAMKVLGLNKAKTRDKVAKRIEDFSENEITSAFQEQCMQLSK